MESYESQKSETHLHYSQPLNKTSGALSCTSTIFFVVLMVRPVHRQSQDPITQDHSRHAAAVKRAVFAAARSLQGEGI